MVTEIDVDELRPLIAWSYFDWAWGVSGKTGVEIDNLHDDANKMLDSWSGRYSANVILQKFSANSDGDDLLIPERNMRIPMLRQQIAPYLCLADFIRPASMKVADEVGVFCTSMDIDVASLYGGDSYEQMLAQTLADRLAEAAAEKVSLMMPGIRPAVGYPSLPDMSLNFLLDELLDMKSAGIRLTESGMMLPHASVSGLIFQHPQAQYFNIPEVGEDQLRDYAGRRGFDLDKMRKFIKI